MSTLHERLKQRTKKAEAAYEQEKQRVKDMGSAQVASRLDNPINSPAATQRIADRQNAKLYADLTNTKWFEQYNNEYGKTFADNKKSAQIASRLDGGSYAANAGTQAAIAQGNKNILSAQVAANLDNSLMGQATRDNAKASLERAMESLYNRMEVAKTAGQTDDYGEMQERYSYFANRLQEAENPESTAAYAYDWENKRRNEIMSTDDRYLMPKLERLVDLSDARMSEASDRGDERRNGLTETEKQYNEIYNSLKQQYGDKVDGWLDYTRREANKRNMAQLEETERQQAKEHKFGASLKSIPANMLSGAGYMDVVAQKMQRGITGSAAPIDYNSAAQSASRITETIRGTVSEDMGATGQFLYNVGMSMADLIPSIIVGKFSPESAAAIGKATIAMLGGAAATNSMQSAVSRGASDNQALMVGLLSGVMEAALEKVPLDKLLNPTSTKTVREIFLNALKQSGTEAAEEGLTTIANTLADAVVMGNRSELQTNIRTITAEMLAANPGMSFEDAEKDATKAALGEWAVNLGMDIAGGALSGGLFGGITAGSDYVRNRNTSPTVADITPTPEQRTQETAPAADITPRPAPAPTEASVMPQATERRPVSEFRQTASEILDDGIFESPTYGEALEQTGMKRADVRQALRMVARNNLSAETNPDVQMVLDAIRGVQAQATPVQSEAAPVPELRTETVDITPEVRQSEQAQPEQTAPVNQSEQGNQPAMGAADAGFSPYSAYQNTQSSFIPEGANAARPVDVPKVDPTGKQTRRFLSNAMGAQGINENTDARLQSDFMEGKYGYDIKGDPEAVQKANDALKQDGYDFVRAQTLERLQSMKSLKQTVVDAQLIALEAQRKGNDADAAEILLLLAETGTEFGQAVQAYSIFRKLTPEGQLEGVRRAVKRINEKAVKKGGKPKYSEADQAAIMDIVDDIRETALQEMESVGAEQTTPTTAEQDTKPKPKKETEKKAGKKEHPKTTSERGSARKRDHGLEVEKWVEEIGNEVARAVGAKPSAPGPKPISRIIKQDLLKFAKDYLPKKPQGQKRTAVDTLTDFFANRKQYVEAWNTAKQAYIAKHGDDTDFAGATMTYNADGSDPVMIQAIVEEVVDSELKKRNIDIRSALGDQASLEKQISDSLINDTGATGTDAAMIKDAVKRYFNETRLGSNAKTVNNNIKSDIYKNIKGIGKKMSDIIRTSPGDKAAVAKRIADMMVKQYGVSPEAAQTAAANIIDRFNNMVAERSKQALEARFKPRDKKAKRTVMERFTELANLGAFTDSNYRQAASEALFGEGIMVDEKLAQKFRDAPDEQTRAKVLEEIYKDIGEKIPTTLEDIANQWRYTAMLLNPSTHIKNVVGSGTQFGMSLVKDAMAIPVEALANKISGGATGRTKAYLNLKSEADLNLLDTAGRYYDEHKADIMGESQYRNTPEGKINQHRTTMKLNNPQTKVAKAVDKILRGVGEAAEWNLDTMDIEDTWISRPRFQTALAGYMKANGLTEVTDEAYAYAKSEAQKTTYRDDNVVSEWASTLGRKTNNPLGKLVRFVINANIPFKRSVANIGVRAVEYSPLGLVKTGTDIAKAAYRKDASAVAGIINDLAANATGSLLWAFGIRLAKDGLLRARGPEDDKEREQLKREGYKDNAFYVGDIPIPIAFLGAASIPLLFGAATQEAIARANNTDEGLTIQDYISVGANALEPLAETTMLRGLSDALETFVDSNPNASITEALAFGLMHTVGNYFGSFMPSVVSRIANAFDRSARQTYVEPDSQFPELDKVLQGLQYKAPGLRNQMVERVDAYGDTVQGGLPDTGNKLLDVLGAIGNVVTPTYPGKIKTTEVDEEMRRLYNAEGVNKEGRTVFISTAPKNFEVDGKTVHLTGDQYEQYQKVYYSSAQKIRDDVKTNEQYADLPDDIKLRAMSDAADYANALAKSGLGVGYQMTATWMKELAGLAPEEVADAIITRSVKNAAEDHEDGKYAGLGELLDNGSIDDQIAIAMLPKETYEKYEEFGKDIPASDLMDALSYKNSEESKGLKDEDDKDIKGETRQDHVKAWLDEKYGRDRHMKIDIWCVLYAKSTCPW